MISSIIHGSYYINNLESPFVIMFSLLITNSTETKNIHTKVSFSDTQVTCRKTSF